jgi:hypothetical protein
MRSSRIQLIPLFRNLAVVTEGTATTKTTLALDVPAFTSILPHAEALFLIVCTDGVASGVVDWNVGVYSGFDRDHQPANATDIASPALGTAGSFRSDPYTALSSFVLESRLQLWWANKLGVSGVRNPILSAVLGVRLYGS